MWKDNSWKLIFLPPCRIKGVLQACAHTPLPTESMSVAHNFYLLAEAAEVVAGTEKMTYISYSI